MGDSLRLARLANGTHRSSENFAEEVEAAFNGYGGRAAVTDLESALGQSLVCGLDRGLRRCGRPVGMRYAPLSGLAASRGRGTQDHIRTGYNCRS